MPYITFPAVLLSVVGMATRKWCSLLEIFALEPTYNQLLIILVIHTFSQR